MNSDDGTGDGHERAQLSLGALVLGGLLPAERAEVERHVASCPACREELASMAVIPSLLRRAEPTSAVMATGAAGAAGADNGGGGQHFWPASQPAYDDGMTRRLLNQVRSERSRRRSQVRRLRAVSAVAAALLAVAALQVFVDRPTAPGPVVDIAMTARGESPASGRAGLTARPWGTAIALELERLPPGTQFVAWAVADDGRREPAASWGATPTGAARLSGATAIPRTQLTRLEITTAAGVPVLTAPA